MRYDNPIPTPGDGEDIATTAQREGSFEALLLHSEQAASYDLCGAYIYHDLKSNELACMTEDGRGLVTPLRLSDTPLDLYVAHIDGIPVAALVDLSAENKNAVILNLWNHTGTELTLIRQLITRELTQNNEA